jgi:hypothetical protein
VEANYHEGEFLFRRRRAIREEAEYRAHLDRLSLGVPTVVGCVKVLRCAGLQDKEVASLFQRAAEVLAGAKEPIDGERWDV